MTTENSTLESIQEEINKNLHELLKSVFSEEDYDLTLRNMIKNIDFVVGGIQDSIALIKSDKTKVNEVFLKKMEKQCYCISSLCVVIYKKLNPDDLATVSNMIYEQSKLFKLG